MPHRRSPSTISNRGLLPILLVAQLMVILDISAVNVALPDMAKDLGISGADITWTITSYSLTSAACSCSEDAPLTSWGAAECS